MGVVTSGRTEVPVTKPVLGGKQQTTTAQVRGDGVAEAVQPCQVDTGFYLDTIEAVAFGVRAGRISTSWRPGANKPVVD